MMMMKIGKEDTQEDWKIQNNKFSRCSEASKGE
jgi:hypothetical protein